MDKGDKIYKKAYIKEYNMLDIKGFGAVGQGVAVETEAIQSAIDFCSEVEKSF